MAYLFTAGRFQGFDNTGAALAGGLVYTYAAGTTTPLATYTNQGGGTPNANPVVLDSAGRASIWLSSSAYRIIVKTSTGTTLTDDDNISAAASLADLVDSSSSAKGTGLIGWIRNAASAVAKTLYQWLDYQDVNVFDFLTAAQISDVQSNTGSLDVTSGMQASHNTGKVVRYPAGTYKFSTITIAAGGIRGDGPGYTKLLSTDTTTANVITFTGSFVNYGPGNNTNNGYFKDFLVSVAQSQKSAGAGIALVPAGGSYTNSPYFENVATNYLPIGIDSTASEFLKVLGCEIRGYTIAGVKINNTYNSDQGDAFIESTAFVTNVANTGAGVLQLASGGVKLVGNKFLGGAYSYQMTYTGSGSTSVLVISGNSMELAGLACISLTRSSGASIFTNITITGNMVGQTPIFVSSDSSGFASEMTVSGNVVSLTTTAYATNLAGITLTNFSRVMAGNNLLRLTGGGTNTGISLVTCTDNIKIGHNVYIGCTAGKAIDTTGSVFTVAKETVGADIILGTTVGTSTAGYSAVGGSFLSALQTVTWANLGLQNPLLTPSVADVQLTSSSGNGTISGVVISATTTGMTFYAITATTGLAAHLAVAVSGVF
jgi:hypothetical protein